MSLVIITAGRTAPNKLVRFGSAASPLDERGRRDVEQIALPDAPVRCGPEVAAIETARLLGAEPAIDAALSGLDVGSWDGLRPDEVATDQLGQWFTDPTATAHGGESVEAFVARIWRWRDTTDAQVIVVTKSVAQALLCDEAAKFFATDIRPATVYQGR